MMSAKSVLMIPVLIIVLLGVFPCGPAAQTSDEEKILDGFEKMTRLLSAIRDNYYNDIPSGNLVDGAIRGVLNKLDPHSSYMSPEETRRFLTEQQGEYYGIGLTVTYRDGQILAISPMEDSPAARSGIRTGDIITHIDGVATTELDYEANVRKLRGPEGTTVTLRIQREGLKDQLDVKLVRAKIEMRTVSHSFVFNGGNGYMRVTGFARDTAREVELALNEFNRTGVQQVILDLRSNPGGDLDAAVGVADLFLDDGLIVFTQGARTETRQDYIAERKTTKWHGPLIVLMNRGSASGAEVVAGALQDQDRALVVGERSWGKGLVQSVFPMSYGASLSLTTSRYYTPSGRLIQRPYMPGEYEDYFNPTGDRETTELQMAYTKSGRKVYGGDGIAPDYVVEDEDLTYFTQQVFLRGDIFDFVTHYMGVHQDITTAFKADSSTMDEFRDYLVNDGMKIDEKQWKKDKDFLAARITMEVVTRLGGADLGYQAVLGTDKQIQKALSLFGEARKLLKLNGQKTTAN